MQKAVDLVKAGGVQPIKLPSTFQIKVEYVNHKEAYFYSWYPNARLEEGHTVSFEAEDFFEIKRFLHFVMPCE